MSRKNDSSPQLDKDKAKALLDNVLAQCDKEPSSADLEVLASYVKYRRERFGLQRIFLIIILICFLILPYWFIAPKFDVHKVSDDSAAYPVYQVAVHTFLPIKLVSAQLDGHNIAVYEDSNNTYNIEPTINGQLNITVTLSNRQYNTQSLLITGIDNEIPKLIETKSERGLLHLYLSDEGSGIDYESAYAVGSSGTIYKPASYDEGTQCITFKDLPESCNLFVSDKNGNTLQLVISYK